MECKTIPDVLKQNGVLLTEHKIIMQVTTHTMSFFERKGPKKLTKKTLTRVQRRTILVTRKVIVNRRLL